MKASLYKVTCVISNLCYYGIVYKKGKTFLDRWEEHKMGKGGKFPDKMITKTIARNGNLKSELIGVTAIDAGFTIIKV